MTKLAALRALLPLFCPHSACAPLLPCQLGRRCAKWIATGVNLTISDAQWDEAFLRCPSINMESDAPPCPGADSLDPSFTGNLNDTIGTGERPVPPQCARTHVYDFNLEYPKLMGNYCTDEMDECPENCVDAIERVSGCV